MPKHDDHAASAFAGNVTEVDESLGRRIHSVAPLDDFARAERCVWALGLAAGRCGMGGKEESVFIVSVEIIVACSRSEVPVSRKHEDEPKPHGPALAGLG